eukprot:TRINITY_DN2696_c0_g2_i1.p1 TRINITY_DN2696_c0_g2~~TRINITY_DN2696_c0_g2_i1.p1  ORF type:complete len:3284 (+),score=967.98 TRINITY_DN2696_c0_g2_i1:200-10051(+)
MGLGEYVAQVLNKVIGKYVDISPKQLSLSLRHGEAVIHNAQVRRSALSELDLPIAIQSGVIRKISVSFSVLSVLSKPFVISIEGLDLVIIPKRCVVYDPEDEVKLKNAMIEAYEAEREEKMKMREEEEKGKKKKGESSGGGKSDKIVQQIVENVIFKARDIKIAYKDSVCNGSLSIGIESIDMFTTNEKWESVYMKDPGSLLYKILTIGGLQLGINGKAIMDPVSIHAKLQRQNTRKGFDLRKELPLIDLSLSLDGSHVRITDRQYKSTLEMLDYFSNFDKMEPLRQYHPHVNSASEEDKKKVHPREWWNYAIQSTLHSLQQQKLRTHINYEWIKQRKKLRDEYIELYKKYVECKWRSPLSDAEEKRFLELQEKLSRQDVLQFRAFGDAQLDKEEEKLIIQFKNKKNLNSTLEKYQKQLRKGSSKPPVIAVGMFNLTPRQQMDAIETVLSPPPPPVSSEESDLKSETSLTSLEDRSLMKKLHVKFNVGDGSLDVADSDGPIFQLIHGKVGFEATMLVNGSLSANMALETFQVQDTSARGSKHSQIFSHDFATHGRLYDVGLKMERVGDDSIANIKLHAAPIRVMVNTELLQRVLAFVVPPPGIHLEELGSAVSFISSKVLTGVKHKQKSISLDVDMGTIKVLIPSSCYVDNPEVIKLHIGHVKLHSVDAAHSVLKRPLDPLFERLEGNISAIACGLVASLEEDAYETILDEFSIGVSVDRCVKHVENHVVVDIPGDIVVHVCPEKLQRVQTVSNRVVFFLKNPMGVHGNAGTSDPLRGFVTVNNQREFAVLRGTRLVFFDDENQNNVIRVVYIDHQTSVDVMPGNNGFVMHMPRVIRGKHDAHLEIQSDFPSHWEKSIRRNIEMNDSWKTEKQEEPIALASDQFEKGTHFIDKEILERVFLDIAASISGIVIQDHVAIRGVKVGMTQFVGKKKPEVSASVYNLNVMNGDFLSISGLTANPDTMNAVIEDVHIHLDHNVVEKEIDFFVSCLDALKSAESFPRVHFSHPPPPLPPASSDAGGNKPLEENAKRKAAQPPIHVVMKTFRVTSIVHSCRNPLLMEDCVATWSEFAQPSKLLGKADLDMGTFALSLHPEVLDEAQLALQTAQKSHKRLKRAFEKPKNIDSNVFQRDTIPEDDSSKAVESPSLPSSTGVVEMDKPMIPVLFNAKSKAAQVFLFDPEDYKREHITVALKQIAASNHDMNSDIVDVSTIMQIHYGQHLLFGTSNTEPLIAHADLSQNVFDTEFDGLHGALAASHVHNIQRFADVWKTKSTAFIDSLKGTEEYSDLQASRREQQPKKPKPVAPKEKKDLRAHIVVRKMAYALHENNLQEAVTRVDIHMLDANIHQHMDDINIIYRLEEFACVSKHSYRVVFLDRSSGKLNLTPNQRTIDTDIGQPHLELHPSYLKEVRHLIESFFPEMEQKRIEREMHFLVSKQDASSSAISVKELSQLDESHLRGRSDHRLSERTEHALNSTWILSPKSRLFVASAPTDPDSCVVIDGRGNTIALKPNPKMEKLSKVPLQERLIFLQGGVRVHFRNVKIISTVPISRLIAREANGAVVFEDSVVIDAPKDDNDALPEKAIDEPIEADSADHLPPSSELEEGEEEKAGVEKTIPLTLVQAKMDSATMILFDEMWGEKSTNRFRCQWGTCKANLRIHDGIEDSLIEIENLHVVDELEEMEKTISKQVFAPCSVSLQSFVNESAFQENTQKTMWIVEFRPLVVEVWLRKVQLHRILHVLELVKKLMPPPRVKKFEDMEDEMDDDTNASDVESEEGLEEHESDAEGKSEERDEKDDLSMVPVKEKLPPETHEESGNVQSFNCALPDFKIHTFDDDGMFDVPLVNVDFLFGGSQMALYSSKHKLFGSARGTMRIDHFHPAHAIWEPVIEPVPFEFTVDGGIERDDTSILFNVSDVCNVSLTPTIIQGLQRFTTFSEKAITKHQNRIEYDPYMIENSLGIPVDVLVRSTKQKFTVGVGEVKGFSFAEDPSVCGEIAFNFPGIGWFDHIECKGSRRFTLETPAAPTVYVSIIPRGGRRVIHLHSIVGFKNNTQFPVTINASHEGDRRSPLAQLLEPGDTFHMPLGTFTKVHFARSPDDVSVSLDFVDIRFGEQKIISFQKSGNSCMLWPQPSSFSSRQNTRRFGKVIHIQAALEIMNLLPETVDVELFEEREDGSMSPSLCYHTISSGLSIPIHSISGINPVMMRAHSDSIKSDELRCIHSFDDEKHADRVCEVVRIMHDCRIGGTHFVKLYAPYWIVNKTSDVLCLNEAILVQPSSNTLYDNVVVKKKSKGEVVYKEKKKIKVRAFDKSDRDGKFSANTAGLSGSITCISKDGAVKDYAVRVELAKDEFFNTRVVTISPRYIVRNDYPTDLEIQQIGTSQKLVISSMSSLAYQFESAKKTKRLLRIRKRGHVDDENGWSPPLRFHAVDDIVILDNVLVKIVTDRLGVAHIILAKSMRKPYVIQNHSFESIWYNQVGQDGEHVLRPFEEMQYDYDFPLGKRKIVIHAGTGTKKIQLNKVGTRKELKVKELTGKKLLGVKRKRIRRRLMAAIDVEGSHRVLRISEKVMKKNVQNKSNSKPKKKPGSSQQSGKTEVVVAEEAKTEPEDAFKPVRFHATFPKMFASLVEEEITTERPSQELTVMHIGGLRISAGKTATDYDLECIIQTFQVDNQMDQASHPIVLIPTLSLGRDGPPFFHMTMIKRHEFEEMDYFPYVGVLMQSIDLHVDDVWIERLSQFGHASMMQVHDVGPDGQERCEGSEVAKHERTMQRIQDALSTDLPKTPIIKIDDRYTFVDVLQINPIVANISVYNNRGGQGESGKRLKALGLNALNLRNVPLRINGFAVKSAFERHGSLIRRISGHYRSQALRQIYRFVGSVALLGNPVSLVSNLGSGVISFFVEPAKGAVYGPKAFGKGVAKGTYQLISKTIFGVFNTAESITRALGDILATVSMDDDFIDSRDDQERKQSKHIFQGLMHGTMSLVRGIAGGVAGIFVAPFKGAKRGGFKGFVKGIGKGVIGVVVKPASGVLDFASHTAQGIKNTPRFFELRRQHQSRPRRVLGSVGNIIPYDLRLSTGLDLLRHAKKGRFRHDNYEEHWQFKKNIVVVTNRRLLIVNPLTYNMSLHIPLHRIETMEIKKNMLVMRFFRPDMTDKNKMKKFFSKMTSVFKRMTRKLTFPSPEDAVKVRNGLNGVIAKYTEELEHIRKVEDSSSKGKGGKGKSGKGGSERDSSGMVLVDPEGGMLDVPSLDETEFGDDDGMQSDDDGDDAESEGRGGASSEMEDDMEDDKEIAME